jgi:hypothetical protein
MKNQDFTVTFSVDQSPEEVFNATKTLAFAGRHKLPAPDRIGCLKQRIDSYGASEPL